MNRSINKSTYFEFSKAYFNSPEKAGRIDLYQVGELELSANSGIPKHKQVCYGISYIFSGNGHFYTDDGEIRAPHEQTVGVIAVRAAGLEATKKPFRWVYVK